MFDGYMIGFRLGASDKSFTTIPLVLFVVSAVEMHFASDTNNCKFHLA